MKLFSMLTAIVLLAFGCGMKPPSIAEEVSYSGQAGGFSAADYSNLTEQRMISSTADISIKSFRPDSVHAAVIEMAYAYNGYILNAEGGKTTIRIPATGFKAALDDIEKLGEVSEKKITGKDVTEEYKDLETRLNNAETTRQRYLQLLEKAQTIEEILRVEKELERLNSEIELLKGKIERLSHIVEYSTITVRTLKETRPGPIGYVFYGIYKGIKWLFVWEKD